MNQLDTPTPHNYVQATMFKLVVDDTCKPFLEIMNDFALPVVNKIATPTVDIGCHNA